MDFFSDRDEYTVWDALNKMNLELMKNDIDTLACTQQILCWHIKESIANIEDGKATYVDKIINGLSNSDWAIEMTSETAFNIAIEAAKNGKNCERLFKKCRLNLR